MGPPGRDGLAGLRGEPVSHFPSFLVPSGLGSYMPETKWLLGNFSFCRFCCYFFFFFQFVLLPTRVNKVNLDHLGRRDFLAHQ